MTGNRGGKRARAGRPKGSKSPSLATKILIAQVKTRRAERPGRDLEAVLAEIKDISTLPASVRLAALRWLGDAMMGRLNQLLPAEPGGDLPRRPGKPRGHRGATAINNALLAQIDVGLAGDPARELGAILSEIASDPSTALDVRLAAVRRLAGAMMGQIAAAIEAEGRRLR